LLFLADIEQSSANARRLHMAKTVVGLMENVDDAQSVLRELVGSGIEREDIGFMANQEHSIPGSADLNESEGSTGNNAGAVGRGGILVTVAAQDDARADLAAGIMREHGAVDIGQRVN
jgi:hypothetical protein